MPVTIRQIIDSLEELAPLELQDDFDNSGLQVGLKDGKADGVLICLDITEDVLDEAAALGLNMVVSHHPLLFCPLKQVTDSSFQQRCVMKAIRNGIALYSSHTSLDNAEGGVNYKIASLMGLRNLEWLQEKSVPSGRNCGSGVVGDLPEAEDPAVFLKRVKDIFGVACIQHSEFPSGKIGRVAVCGGSGSFLMDDARAMGADCFITGEISYHHFFDNEGMMLAAIGHYQSEQFTMDLLAEYLSSRFPGLRVEKTTVVTNPIKYFMG